VLIQEHGVRAVFVDVARDVEHGIDRAQIAKNAGRPRVSPTLLSTPFFFGISMS
jgi:hypothetical protein